MRKSITVLVVLALVSITSAPATADQAQLVVNAKVLTTNNVTGIELFSDPKALMESAVASIEAAYKQSGKASVTYKYINSKDADLKVVKALKPYLQKGMRFFSPYMTKSNVTVISFGSKSISWAQKQLNTVLSGSGIKHKITDCSGGFEWSFKKDDHIEHVWLNCSTDRFAMQGTVNSAHPATHFFQGEYKSHRMPAWVVEGPATLYGDVLGYGSKSSKATKNNWGGQTALKNVLKAGNEEKVISVIKKLEGQNDRFMGNVYTLGKMMTAALIGAYGNEKFIEFSKLFATSDDYEANFQSSFGITTDEFYKKLVPVLKDWATRY